MKSINHNNNESNNSIITTLNAQRFYAPKNQEFKNARN